MIEPVDDDWWKRGPAADNDDDEETDVERDDDPVVECPHCGGDVFDDAEQCPACGWWMVGDRRATRSKPSWWMWLGIVGAILALATWILGR